MSKESAAATRRRRLLLTAAVAALVIAADQVTKSLAVADLSRHSVHIIGPVALRLQYNSGVAFSIGTGLTGPIIVVAVVLIVAVGWFARNAPSTKGAIALGLILGGAAGNLADRLFRGNHGAVVDFLYTRYWPTFNVADASIVCGCVLLAWSILWPGRTAGDGPAATPAGPEGTEDGPEATR